MLGKELETIADIPTFNHCSNNSTTHTRLQRHKHKHTHTHTHTRSYMHREEVHNNPTHSHTQIPLLFSSVQSLSYMLSPRPYNADPLCSDILFFVLEKNLSTGSQPVCALPIHTTGLSEFALSRRGLLPAESQLFRGRVHYLMSATCSCDKAFQCLFCCHKAEDT